VQYQVEELRVLPPSLGLDPASAHYYLGIDGGGSKCKAVIVDADGRALGSALSGPANPFHGMEATLKSIEEVAHLALQDAGLPGSLLPQLVVGAGLAGVNVPRLFQAVSEWRHPFGAFYLTTDLRIACLGAHQRDHGAVIVVGTGSSGYARVDGIEHLHGGYGFPYGDQGSGAWMGMEAIKAILLASDRIGPATRLTESVAQMLGARGIAVVEQMSGRPSSDCARLAPLVFAAAEAGDPVAQKILTEGAGYISALAAKLLEYQPGRLALIGGLSEQFEAWLTPGVAKQLSEPLDSPEAGAVLFARQQHLARVAGEDIRG